MRIIKKRAWVTLNDYGQRDTKTHTWWLFGIIPVWRRKASI